MKLKSLLLVLILAVAAGVTHAQSIALPYSCAKILDQRYRGWKFAEIGEDVIRWFLEAKQPYRPNLIKGDWNGDRRIDYAALIQTANTTPNNSGVFLAVFMKTAAGYRLYRLWANDYIAFIEKGGKDYDYSTGRTFTYRNDAIFTGIFEKGGTSFVWRKGKFIGITTSD